MSWVWHKFVFREILLFFCSFILFRGEGDDSKAFRSAYGQLAELRSFLNRKVPIIALTTTATKEMRVHIVENYHKAVFLSFRHFCYCFLFLSPTNVNLSSKNHFRFWKKENLARARAVNQKIFFCFWLLISSNRKLSDCLIFCSYLSNQIKYLFNRINIIQAPGL